MSNSQLLLKAGFPRAPISNGIGRYIGQLQRVTLKFCENHGASRCIRDFIEKDLIDYSRANPGVAVYVKPRRHRGPVIKAEYLNGQVHWIPCYKFLYEDVVKYMELIRTQAFDGSTLRLRKFNHTEFPSIQGPWTPFTFRDPKLNITDLPDEKIGARQRIEPTATEKVIELLRKQQEEDEIAEKCDVQKVQN